MDHSPRRRWFRFSLVSFAFAVTTTALALGLWSAHRENVRLDAENRRLAGKNSTYRDELGILEIEELGKIHAIRVETPEAPLTHRFRVYVPPGRPYEARLAVHKIPTSDLPTSALQSDAMEIGSGESLITCTLMPQYDRATGNPTPFATIAIDVEGAKHHRYMMAVSERDNDWIINKHTKQFTYSLDRVERAVEKHDVDEPVVLLRLRAEEIVPHARDGDGKVTSWSTMEIPGPCDGFMLWIQSKGAAAP
jgi:hypothetical protein